MDEALKYVILAEFSVTDFLLWVKSGMFVKCAYHVHNIFDFRKENEEVVRLWPFSQHARRSNCVCCPRCQEDIVRAVAGTAQVAGTDGRRRRRVATHSETTTTIRALGHNTS